MLRFLFVSLLLISVCHGFQNVAYGRLSNYFNNKHLVVRNYTINSGCFFSPPFQDIIPPHESGFFTIGCANWGPKDLTTNATVEFNIKLGAIVVGSVILRVVNTTHASVSADYVPSINFESHLNALETATLIDLNVGDVLGSYSSDSPNTTPTDVRLLNTFADTFERVSSNSIEVPESIASGKMFSSVVTDDSCSFSYSSHDAPAFSFSSHGDDTSLTYKYSTNYVYHCYSIFSNVFLDSGKSVFILLNKC
ncbi:hypothetical protein RCL1_000377 [Eukaryota sp. TZLM3-RCL]